MKIVLLVFAIFTSALLLLMTQFEVEGRVYRCHHNLTGVHPQKVLACEPPGYCKPHKTEFINDSLGVCRCPTGQPGCPILVQLTERCEEEGPDVMYKCENRFDTTECRIENRSLGQTWGDCSCIPGFEITVPEDEKQVYYTVRARDCQPIPSAAIPLSSWPFLVVTFLTLYLPNHILPIAF